MDIIVIVLLVVLAIFLVVVEVLLLPGVTVAAFGALAAGIYAAYLTYDIAGLPMAMTVFIASLVISIITVMICLRHLNISRISLEINSDSIVLPDVKNLVSMGETGVALTRLAPMGTVIIGDKSYEAKSRNGLVDPKSNIKVIGYEDNIVIVEKIIR